MSVSTPILTTSSEICCAEAVVAKAAIARPAAASVANDFIVSSPSFFYVVARSNGIRQTPQSPTLSGGEGNHAEKSGVRFYRRSEVRQLGDGDADRAGGLRNHAQRLGVVGDVGELQAGDVGINPHSIPVLLEGSDRVRDLLLRIGGKRLEVDGR